MLYGRLDELREHARRRLSEALIPGGSTPQARMHRDASVTLARRGLRPTEIDDVPTGMPSRRRRVSALAATGLGVNEVAQRLFLTPGTVRAVLESTSDDPP